MTLQNKADENADRPVLILLAEDNSDHAELIQTCFQDQNLLNEVRHVRDGEMAIDYLLQQGKFEDPATSPRPDLILLDLRMPKIDGLEVLSRIKSTEGLKRIPVVILTTSDAESDVAKASDLHANSYLVKPIGFEDLFELLKDMGFYWLAMNRVANPEQS